MRPVGRATISSGQPAFHNVVSPERSWLDSGHLVSAGVVEQGGGED